MKTKTKCPKCRASDLLITEVIEAFSEHRVTDGVWICTEDNNEYGSGLRIECACMRCGYRWTGRKGSFDDYFIYELD